MQAVKMYTTAVCPYCIRAKQLLKLKGVDQIEEIRVDTDPAALAAAIAHRLDRADHVHAVFARRLKAEDLAQPVENGRRGGRWKRALFRDARRAVRR